ncbi:hypothetical protein [Tuwongella immobilis]|uniref:Glycosyltransferase RgtA/B/C/D-like domain-containing protein n=1 Tax=Tuwongella immobilis TaxID=692036 RepID=A0A6C2YUS2_9BACT|nr:hypothetical protein [Tuwongella immobilis]VIP04665.1 unnamed protein product [Tuwongella immobilis]VTS06691.1 unnamed protein product [Tuwongella immobilis]
MAALAPVSDPPSNDESPHPPANWWWLFAYWMLTLAVTILGWPYATDFKQWLLLDQGTALRLDQLVAQGRIPTIDFNYFYGPMGVLLTRTIHALTPLNPIATFQIVQGLSGLGMAWVVWRMSEQGQWSAPIRILIGVWLFWFVIPTHASFVHLFEKCFLLVALMRLLAGSRTGAICWALLACTVKAGLGQVLLAWILVWECRDYWLRIKTPRQVWHTVRLPVLLGLGLLTLFVMCFGGRAVWQMLVPLVPMRFYREEEFGFWGKYGRAIWDPAQNSWMDFVFEPFLSWMLLTLIVAIVAGVELFRQGSRPSSAALETRSALALLAIVGMFVLYGHPATWIYFCPFTFLAVASVLALLPEHSKALPRIVFGLVLLTGLPMMTTSLHYSGRWESRQLFPEHPWLGQSPGFGKEYQELLARNPEPFVLLNGFPEGIFDPRILAPECSWVTTIPVFTPQEQDRLRALVRGRRIGVPIIRGDADHARIQQWPLMRELLAGRKSLWRGKLFELFDVPES